MAHVHHEDRLKFKFFFLTSYFENFGRFFLQQRKEAGFDRLLTLSNFKLRTLRLRPLNDFSFGLARLLSTPPPPLNVGCTRACLSAKSSFFQTKCHLMLAVFYFLQHIQQCSTVCFYLAAVSLYLFVLSTF